MGSSVPRRVACFQPAWRKCMPMTIRPASTTVYVGLSETNTIGYYEVAYQCRGWTSCIPWDERKRGPVRNAIDTPPMYLHPAGARPAARVKAWTHARQTP